MSSEDSHTLKVRSSREAARSKCSSQATKPASSYSNCLIKLTSPSEGRVEQGGQPHAEGARLARCSQVKVLEPDHESCRLLLGIFLVPRLKYDSWTAHLRGASSREDSHTLKVRSSRDAARSKSSSQAM